MKTLRPTKVKWTKTTEPVSHGARVQSQICLTQKPRLPAVAIRHLLELTPFLTPDVASLGPHHTPLFWVPLVSALCLHFKFCLCFTTACHQLLPRP